MTCAKSDWKHEAADQTIAQERRRHVRKRVLWTGTLETEDGSFSCIILNISRSGAKLQFAAPILSPRPVELVIEASRALGAEVVWQIGDKMGVRFTADPEQVVWIIGHALTLRGLELGAEEPAAANRAYSGFDIGGRQRQILRPTQG